MRKKSQKQTRIQIVCYINDWDFKSGKFGSLPNIKKVKSKSITTRCLL